MIVYLPIYSAGLQEWWMIMISHTLTILVSLSKNKEKMDVIRLM